MPDNAVRLLLSRVYHSELNSALRHKADGERLNRVDLNRLRESAVHAGPDLLADLSEKVEPYLTARRRLVGDKLDSVKLPARLTPKPAIARLLVVSGLAWLTYVAAISSEGSRGTTPAPYLLVGVASLLIVAVLLEIALGRRDLPWFRRTQAACVGLAAVGIFLSISEILDQPGGTEGASGTATALLAAGLFVGAILVPFLRWREYKRDGNPPRVLLDPYAGVALAAIPIPAILVSLIIEGSENRALYFTRVDTSLAMLGVVVALLGGLLAFVTFSTQPKDVLIAELREVDSRLSEYVMGNVVLPFLRKTADDEVDSFDLTLAVGETPGLSQTFDPLFQVSTVSVARLSQLIDAMPGGSIGIAGPRGSGKSTLIEQFCHPGDDVLTVTVSAPVDYVPREFLLHLYGSLCERVVGVRHVGDPIDFSSVLVGRRQRIAAVVNGVLLLVAALVLIWIPTTDVELTTSQLVGVVVLIVALSFIFHGLVRQRPLLPKRGNAGDFLIDLAEERLREIRYQQTVTDTTTGAAKMPTGLEATYASGRSFLQQQLSLPEIVASLRSFLEVAAERKRVIVGIDELDKIGSGSKAVHFLNEIKGIFGVRGCFFLVSVSEDAMAGFERRGLPFRDVFDSSFDDVARVEPLVLGEASTLLQRRLFGMPAPFKQLCYCQSGGTPRDLIRAARTVVSISRERNLHKLADIAAAATHADLQGKVTAARLLARWPECEPFTSKFLTWLGVLGQYADRSDSILNSIEALDSADMIAAAARLAGDRAGSRELRDLVVEVASYSYFSATVIDFFSQDAPLARWHTGGPDPSVEDLVRARRSFAASPFLAWNEISTLRNALSLPCVSAPSWMMD